ncbi:MAG: FixH family protein [Pseudomonadota bacterium]|nr:FixH family protein [Pseudomonadota bacterium]
MVLLLTACAAVPEPAAAGEPIASDGALYTMTLAFSPDPPVAGDALLTVDVPDATSITLEGAMVGMDHGLTEEPVITGGDGHWEIDAYFAMSGTWQLTFELDGEPGPDSLTTSVDIR